MSVTSLKLE